MKVLLITAALLTFCYSASAEPYQWSPPNGEYSVAFGGKPEANEVASSSGGSIVTSQTAAYQGGDIAEKAESRSYIREAVVTKDAAYKQGSAWANSFGMKNIEMSFDDSSRDDVRLTIKGFKVVQTSSVDVTMNFVAVWHWGRETIFVLWIADPTQTYPSREGQRFLASVRQKVP